MAWSPRTLSAALSKTTQALACVAATFQGSLGAAGRHGWVISAAQGPLPEAHAALELDGVV
jgi:hypothetical protein